MPGKISELLSNGQEKKIATARPVSGYLCLSFFSDNSVNQKNNDNNTASDLCS
jgi:hypothetical protein